MKRLIVAVAALAVALAVQLTIVNGLALPGGGVPDLVLLCVVAIGLVGGPQPGILAGFLAGLALDLAPPANELIGQYALVFCLAGYCCGRLRFTLRRSAVLALAAAAGIAVAAELLVAGLVLILDTPQVTLSAVGRVLPASVLWDLVLSPLVIFVAVRVAVALGVSFNPLDDSPAYETGGSARPMGLARLAADPAAEAAQVGAVGAVGWLNGPATSRRARREKARLTAALTGAAPRKGAFWIGSRPAGLRRGSAAAPGPASGLSRLRPDSGVAGSAMRADLATPASPASPARPARSASIDFSTGKTAGAPAGGRGGRPGTGASVPKIAFGRGGRSGVPGRSGRPGSPGSGRVSGRGDPRIAFRTGRMGGVPVGGLGQAGRRKTPRIAFGTGLPRAPRTSPGRPALPRFRPGARSAAGAWLAGSRLRSAGFSPLGSPGPRSRRPRGLKAAKLRRRRRLRWLPRFSWLSWSRRPGGRSAVWRISKQTGGQR